MSSNEWRSNGKCRIHICISNLIDLVLVPLRSNRFRRERDTFTKIWKKKNTNLIIRRSLSLKARRFTLIAYLLPLIPLSINHRLRKIKSFSKLHCNFSKFLSATHSCGKMWDRWQRAAYRLDKFHYSRDKQQTYPDQVMTMRHNTIQCIQMSLCNNKKGHFTNIHTQRP